MHRLSEAERLKFEILAQGITPSETASQFLRASNEDRRLSPADYASTSGLILRLEDEVWVNAPVVENNPNFVTDSGELVCLDIDADGLVVTGHGQRSRAWFWRPPLFLDGIGSDGRPYNNFVYTHGDRVRVSPIQGCAMVCKFCNIPYEDRYNTKPIESMVEALRVALCDELQPARHILISGGTPHERDFEYLQEAYRRILTEFSEVPVDIMMVPVDGLLNVPELADLGVNELSINIEIIDERLSRQHMRQKLQHGLDHYLRFIESASAVLGDGKVRSMLMVGLEPPEQTLRGVELVLGAGGVPVLSPFRPDPATPLAGMRPLSASDMIHVYHGAKELAVASGIDLGPSCPPCTHNTITLSGQDAQYLGAVPHLV